MATRVSSLAVQIEAIGTEKVKSALRELGVEGEKTSNHLQTHYGKAARHLSLVTNEAVRAGEIGGSALQKILVVGGDMAGMFGATGAVVGALAITGLAIYNYFDKAQKKIEEMAKTARAELRSLRDASAESAATALNRLSTGDEFADDPQQRKSRAQLEAERNRLASRAFNTTNAKTGEVTRSLDKEDSDALEKVNAELDRRNAIRARGLQLLTATATAEGRRVIEEGKAGLVAKAATEEQQALNLAIKRGQDASESATRSLMAKLAIEEEARQTRIKAGIRGPGDMTDMGAAASDTGGALGDLRKKNAFDYKAYFEELSGGTDGLLPKIQSPLNQMADQIRGSISHTLGSAIYEGFRSAFSGKGLSGIFKGFGKTLMQGLGQLISDQGMLYLEYSGIMQAFTPLLGNPFTAGYAGAAIGAALLALGAALGAAASGGGGGSAHASIPRPAEITNIKLTATSVADQARYEVKTPIAMTVIGPGDPVAFRQIQEGLDNHGRR